MLEVVIQKLAMVSRLATAVLLKGDKAHLRGAHIMDI